MASSKRDLFLKRRMRVRNALRKTSSGRMRLSVHRSSKNISAQLIDDVNGVTLASASTLEKDLGVLGHNNVEAAAKVGAAIAERAKKAGIDTCYFDRGGFLFHGKVKALADAAREGRAEVLTPVVAAPGAAAITDSAGGTGRLDDPGAYAPTAIGPTGRHGAADRRMPHGT